MFYSQILPKDLKYINMAIKIANKGKDNHRHGCILVKGSNVVSRGKNSYDNGMHAEESCLNKCKPDNLDGTTLYVVRLRRNQPVGMSAPCKNCFKYIKNSGIKRVVYTTDYMGLEAYEFY